MHALSMFVIQFVTHDGIKEFLIKTASILHLIVAGLLEARKLEMEEFSIWIKLDNA
jgi:hypothetical protein